MKNRWSIRTYLWLLALAVAAPCAGVLVYSIANDASHEEREMRATTASAPERPVTFQVQPGLIAHGDAGSLRVLMENLLGNSWKFTRKHGAPRIGSGQARGAAAFFVRDNGAEFDMKYPSKLFGAFERLHSPGEYEGHGIGLATVQRIVHRHGGQAWGEGRPGNGAIFHFTPPDGNGSGAKL